MYSIVLFENSSVEHIAISLLRAQTPLARVHAKRYGARLLANLVAGSVDSHVWAAAASTVNYYYE